MLEFWNQPKGEVRAGISGDNAVTVFKYLKAGLQIIIATYAGVQKSRMTEETAILRLIKETDYPNLKATGDGVLDILALREARLFHHWLKSVTRGANLLRL